ncbi:MAG: porin family protein [Flavobacteriaceae bacterium]|nr:porin family protein [Flavobacteriaceae bacterium]
MKKILSILSILALTTFGAKAESFYVGIDYLHNSIDTGVTNISSNLDEDDTGFSLYAGGEVNQNLDIEVSYNDFGEASLSGVSGNQFSIDGTTYQFNATATLTSSATSYGIAAKPKLNVNDNVQLYGKIGLHRWDSEFAVSSTTATASLNDSGTDIFYGAGIAVGFNNLTGRVGYSIYDLDGEDVTSINAGLSYKF